MPSSEINSTVQPSDSLQLYRSKVVVPTLLELFLTFFTHYFFPISTSDYLRRGKYKNEMAVKWKCDGGRKEQTRLKVLIG